MVEVTTPTSFLSFSYVYDDDDLDSSISSRPKRKTERQRDFCSSVVVLRNTFIMRRKRGGYAVSFL